MTSGSPEARHPAPSARPTAPRHGVCATGRPVSTELSTFAADPAGMPWAAGRARETRDPRPTRQRASSIGAHPRPVPDAPLAGAAPAPVARRPRHDGGRVGTEARGDGEETDGHGADAALRGAHGRGGRHQAVALACCSGRPGRQRVRPRTCPSGRRPNCCAADECRLGRGQSQLDGPVVAASTARRARTPGRTCAPRRRSCPSPGCRKRWASSTTRTCWRRWSRGVPWRPVASIRQRLMRGLDARECAVSGSAPRDPGRAWACRTVARGMPGRCRRPVLLARLRADP
jgi:hypothetical protein